MSFSGLALEGLPIILAGPILRRVEPGQVTVWAALKESRTVRLVVFDGGQRVLEGERGTAPLGTHLHLAAVTAREGQRLSEDRLYTYDLRDAQSGESLLASSGLALGYEGGSDLPSFVLPAGVTARPDPGEPPPAGPPPATGDAARLRIVHASCRKPHGEGRDMLARVDGLIEAGVGDPAQRPQMLFLTGDQIYADDVADALLFLLRDAAQVLQINTENLGALAEGRDTRPGMRRNVVTGVAGLTVDPGASHSHLLTFAEFCAMYLFAWSPELWPGVDQLAALDFDDFFPLDAPEDVRDSRRAAFRRDRRHLAAFREDLPQVRRALANIPTYMILDDHEVTDDLFLHREWCQDVLGPASRLGRRVMQNGLAACALFQAWGNLPEQFEDGEPGAALLNLLPDLHGDAEAERELDTRLGLPPAEEVAAWKDDERVALGPRPGALPFHFTIEGSDYRITFLNTRGHRAFPPDNDDAPAELIGDVREQLPAAKKPLAIIVSPSPVFGVGWIEDAQAWQRWTGGKAKADYERWDLSASRAALLSRLSDLAVRVEGESEQTLRAVILSGDVHYGYASLVRYSDIAAHVAIAEFTASSLKNQTSGTFSTLSAQKRGYEWDFFFGDTDAAEPQLQRLGENACLRHHLKDGIQADPPTRLPVLDELANLMGGDNRVIPDGTQIVGFNNLGVVTFEIDAQGQTTAVQTLHWLTPDGTAVTTSYHVGLTPERVTCEGA